MSTNLSRATFPGQCVAGDPFSFPAFTGLGGTDSYARIPYSQQWNLSIQHTFKTNWLVEAAYIGNNAHKLEGRENVNNPLPGLGDIQPRRPYPEFGTVGLVRTRYNSNYKSMQWTLKHEFAQGFSLLAGYTWSKWLDDLTEDSAVPFNPLNFQLNKGVSDLNVPHKFTTAFIWELPSSHQGGALKYLTAGWQLSGILSAQSGYPFTPTFSGDVTNTGLGSVLPDRVCDGKLSNPTPDSPEAWLRGCKEGAVLQG